MAEIDRVQPGENEIIVVRANSLSAEQMEGLVWNLLGSGHSNTVVFLKPGESLETVSEETMREHGWCRCDKGWLESEALATLVAAYGVGFPIIAAVVLLAIIFAVVLPLFF